MCNHENAAQTGAKRSSNALEKQCQADPKYSGQVLFRTSFPSPAGTSTKTTRPDAITANKKQCFDFKLCGDSFRGDQKERQAGISSGADPIEISCKACTKCNPSCTCPTK
jgi:hypothetical protein